MIRGMIYYRNNDYTAAEPAFREQIALSPDAPASAEAYYYLGAVLESRGETDAAVSNYTRATATNPGSIIADDALWWRGRIMEDSNRLDDARALYARIVAEYPHSTWAPDAAFRRGMLLYRVKRYQEASTIWGESLGAVSGLNRERLSFWQGKALLRDGKQDAARQILQQLAQANEDDYYGVRAQSLLAGDHNLPESTRESNVNLNPSFDWTAAETWLAAKTGRAVADPGWGADARWLRAQELWLVGRTGQGDGEVFDLLEAFASDPNAMYTLSRELAGRGRIGMSGRAGQRLLRALNTNPNQGLPKPLLSLAYPPAFGQSAQRYASAEKISPLLMLAFIRQESFFDPRAISPAGALGLTQVLPTTAKSLATRMGIGDVTDDGLFQADLNLRLGARYMADQLKEFDNEIFVAFAAYNAGPNAAARWRDASGEDADVFLETVEYSESRLYVELVAENYAIYRYLYAGEPYPNLPD
jgi:soluble lytic murein transglycosylase